MKKTHETTIRRDRERYEDTCLAAAAKIAIGAPVVQLPDWDDGEWTEIRSVLQDAAEATDTLIAELRNPVAAYLGPVTDELKRELGELGWNKAAAAEPLDKAAGVIHWTRHDSGGDVDGTAIHLLNAAEVAEIEGNTLSTALDDIWDAKTGTVDEKLAALERLTHVLEQRSWSTPTRRIAANPSQRPATGGLLRLDVAAVFSDTPGPRYRSQGQFSGEEFRDEHLLPAVAKAIATNLVVAVEIGNVQYGCPIGWLSEVFGGARRALGKIEATKRIRIVGGHEATSEVADAYDCLNRG